MYTDCCCCCRCIRIRIYIVYCCLSVTITTTQQTTKATRPNFMCMHVRDQFIKSHSLIKTVREQMGCLFTNKVPARPWALLNETNNCEQGLFMIMIP